MDILIPKPNDISEIWWKEVSKKLSNCIVFIDEFISETLHYNGGIQRLLNSGCKDVKEFSLFESVSEDYNEVVFLISSPLHGLTLDTLRDIVKGSKFTSVCIVTCCHLSVHSFVYHGDNVDKRNENVFQKIEKDVLGWLENQNSSVEIFYYPLILIPLLEDTFLMPIFSDVTPVDFDILFDGKIDQKLVSSPDELYFEHLPSKLQISIQHLIVSLHSFLQGMCAREELYSIGHLSRIVASRLETFNPARQRRKTAAHKVSVVFVDRNLDLASPTDFGNSVLMNRILSVLQRLPGHSVDAEVDLTPITSVHPSCGKTTLLPGCFAHTDDILAKEIFALSIGGTKKQILDKLNTEINDLLIEDEIQSDKDEGCSSIEILYRNILKLSKRKENILNHFDLIQQGLCIVQALTNPQNDDLDRLHSLQKLFLQSLCDESAELPPAQQILQLLKTRKTKGIRLTEILGLFFYVASLLGHLALKGVSEHEFVRALSQALVEDIDESSFFFNSVIGDREMDDVSALKLSSFMWKRLDSVSKARTHLKTYRNLLSRNSEMEPITYKSFLSQLVRDILKPPPEPSSDLEYRSTGFKDMIKTGFSLFVNVTKPRPKDAALIMIYVLGGVTPSEIQDVQKEVRRSNPSCEVIIGSSHLTYPDDVIGRFLERGGVRGGYK